jgi:hypothetical protein
MGVAVGVYYFANNVVVGEDWRWLTSATRPRNWPTN